MSDMRERLFRQATGDLKEANAYDKVTSAYVRRAETAALMAELSDEELLRGMLFSAFMQVTEA